VVPGTNKKADNEDNLSTAIRATPLVSPRRSRPSSHRNVTTAAAIGAPAAADDNSSKKLPGVGTLRAQDVAGYDSSGPKVVGSFKDTKKLFLADNPMGAQ
jgi:hypothetical protein